MPSPPAHKPQQTCPGTSQKATQAPNLAPSASTRGAALFKKVALQVMQSARPPPGPPPGMSDEEFKLVQIKRKSLAPELVPR